MLSGADIIAGEALYLSGLYVEFEHILMLSLSYNLRCVRLHGPEVSAAGSWDFAGPWTGSSSSAGVAAPCCPPSAAGPSSPVPTPAHKQHCNPMLCDENAPRSGHLLHPRAGLHFTQNWDPNSTAADFSYVLPKQSIYCTCCLCRCLLSSSTSSTLSRLRFSNSSAIPPYLPSCKHREPEGACKNPACSCMLL